MAPQNYEPADADMNLSGEEKTDWGNASPNASPNAYLRHRRGTKHRNKHKLPTGLKIAHDSPIERTRRAESIPQVSARRGKRAMKRSWSAVGEQMQQYVLDYYFLHKHVMIV